MFKLIKPRANCQITSLTYSVYHTLPVFHLFTIKHAHKKIILLAMEINAAKH